MSKDVEREIKTAFPACFMSNVWW